MIDFAGMEARADAATPGPWRAAYLGSDEPEVVTEDKAVPRKLPMTDAEAIFIAHAREDIPVLLGERLRAVTRLRELEQEARDELARLTRDVDFAPTPDLIALEARAIAFNAAVDVVLGVGV